MLMKYFFALLLAAITFAGCGKKEPIAGQDSVAALLHTIDSLEATSTTTIMPPVASNGETTITLGTNPHPVIVLFTSTDAIATEVLPSIAQNWP